MSNGIDFKKMAVDLRQQLTGMTDDRDAERLRADTAVAEVAAFREELAQAAHMRTFWAESAAELDKRLTAAGQRNALMSQFLKRMLDGHGMDRLAAWQSEIDMVLTDACDKPTESGASE